MTKPHVNFQKKRCKYSTNVKEMNSLKCLSVVDFYRHNSHSLICRCIIVKGTMGMEEGSEVGGEFKDDEECMSQGLR